MSKTICIYHGNCADGFTAAWALHKNFQNVVPIDFVPGVYGEAPPDVTHKHVVLVDFSYKRDVLMEMASKADFVLILDHHESAAIELEGIQRVTNMLEYGAYMSTARENGLPRIAALFDMERSGAGITWDFMSEGAPRPALVDYVEDRDLWRFNLPRSREVNAYVFAHEYTFEVWDNLHAEINRNRDAAADKGAAIEKKHHRDVRELVKTTRRKMVIGGTEVSVANLPYTLSSDAGHLMGAGEPFAACYWDTPTGRVFSLRSSPDGLNVSEIARCYGGGGHPHAAGFTMPLGWEGDAA